MPTTIFTAESPERLSTHLDYTFFLDLEQGYCETAGSRIRLYADADRWAN